MIGTGPGARSRRAVSGCRRGVLLALCLFGGGLSAEVTNHIDAVALARRGEGVADDGWELHSVTNFSKDLKYALRLPDPSSYVVSSNFPAAVLSVTAQIRSSAKSGRRLKIVPWIYGEWCQAESYLFDYSPTENIFTNETVCWSAQLDVRAFRLELEGSGTTGWGVLWLDIVTDEEYAGPVEPALVDGAISLESLPKTGPGTRAFRLSLEKIDASSISLENGMIPGVMAYAIAGGALVTEVKANTGETQYQGHYAWVQGKTVTGIGTYSSSGVERETVFLFRNDTDETVELAGITVDFGQWGKLNTVADRLVCGWRVVDRREDAFNGGEWSTLSASVFETPYTAADTEAVLPYLERRVIEPEGVRLRPGELLAVRFLDSQPPSGKNAALGIGGLEVRFRRGGGGTAVFFR